MGLISTFLILKKFININFQWNVLTDELLSRLGKYLVSYGHHEQFKFKLPIGLWFYDLSINTLKYSNYIGIKCVAGSEYEQLDTFFKWKLAEFWENNFWGLDKIFKKVLIAQSYLFTPVVLKTIL